MWVILMNALFCLTFSYTKGDLDFTYVTSRIIGKCLMLVNYSLAQLSMPVRRLITCFLSFFPSDVLSSGQC